MARIEYIRLGITATLALQPFSIFCAALLWPHKYPDNRMVKLLTVHRTLTVLSITARCVPFNSLEYAS
jgi:hypothetical protein